MADTSSDRERSRVKKPTKKNARGKDALASDGVLANLPRTRPQRSSARRDAARRAVSTAEAKPTGDPAGQQRRTASAKAQPAPTAGGKPRPTAAKAQLAATPAPKQTVAKKRPAKSKATAKPPLDPAPRQGFETERDPVSGPVQPPGGVDLLSSAAELAGELTKSGLSTGGRLLKDVFARLPLN
jgi:hypothetical protein